MVRPKFLIACIDLVLAFLSLNLAYLLRFGALDQLHEIESGSWFRIVCFLLAINFAGYFFELFDVQRFQSRKYVLSRALFSVISAFFLLSALFYLLPELQFGRGLLFISLVLVWLCQVGVRLAIRKFSRVSQFANRILIVGSGELAQKIFSVIPKDANPYSYVRFVAGGKEQPKVPEEQIIGEIENLKEIIHDYRPQKLIVSLTERRGALPLKEIMHSKLRGVEVFDAPTFYEQATGRLLVENIQPSAFIYTEGFRMTTVMRHLKRIVDIFFSSAGLLLALPVFPIVALAIKLDSPGPVFYKQLRVGEMEVEYFVYKFRTMRQDAEKSSGAVWAQENDPRVTKVGQFMRKTRIDEIPQLYNVLKGDMSFVGPRPERMAFVERLKQTIPYYSTRHFVKPGVTGWAQVCYPYGASEEDALEKLRYDLYYIKNYSVFLDLKIILDTVRVVTSGFGGR